MKKRFIIAFILASAFGSAMHFFYDWLPLPIIGLFAPVSESVWEHMKIMFWPFMLSAVFLTRKMPDKHRAWHAFLTAALLQPPVMVGAFYLLRGGFGVESLVSDIALYFLVMGAGYALTYARYHAGKKARSLGLLVIMAAIYAVMLVIFSVAMPGFPIFMAP